MGRRAIFRRLRSFTEHQSNGKTWGVGQGFAERASQSNGKSRGYIEGCEPERVQKRGATGYVVRVRGRPRTSQYPRAAFSIMHSRITLRSTHSVRGEKFSGAKSGKIVREGKVYSGSAWSTFSTIPCLHGMVLLLSRRSRVGWEEESEEEGRAGRGGGDRKPLPPFVAVRITPRLGTCPTFGLNFCASSDTQWIPADSCGFLRIPVNS